MTTWVKSMRVRYPLTSMYTFHRNTGLREELAVSNFILHKGEPLTAVPFLVDENHPSVTSLQSNQAKMLTYKNRSIDDVVLIADGGRLKVYNGTNVRIVSPRVPSTEEQADPGLNDLTNLYNFRTFALKRDRIFAAAHPQIKNRLSFSHHDEQIGYAAYDYWPAAFFIDVAVEDNDEIVELKVFRDMLIIFCKRSVWALRGDGTTISDYQLHKINVPKGCFSPGSVKEVGNDLYYLSEDHVYRLYSTDQNYVSGSVVSMEIEKTMKAISRADKEKAVSTFHDNKYYLSFPSGVCLVYDVQLQSWAKWTNIRANSFIEREGELYFSSNDGYIYRFNENVYSDDGRRIPFLMKSKLIDFNLPVQEKKIRKAWVVAKQYDNAASSFDLSALIDYYRVINLNADQGDMSANIGGVWDGSLWDDAVWDFADVLQMELRLKQRAKNLQIIISNDKNGEPVTIYGLAFEYKVKKP